MPKKIKISIITISYNSGKTIEDTILSVINQNYDNLEYIVIDGGSTDDTIELINKYRSFIDVFISEKDKGISDAFNKGIRLATGEIVGIINSDDYLNRNTLENVANFIESNAYADVYYGNCISFSDTTNLNYIYKPSDDLKKMPLYMIPSHPATFIRKSTYEKYGEYSTEYKCAMDFDILSRMYKQGAVFKYMDINTTWFRLGGTSGKQLKTTCDESTRIAIQNGINPKVAKKWYSYILTKQRVIGFLQEIGIEGRLRRIFKKQKIRIADQYWFK